MVFFGRVCGMVFRNTFRTKKNEQICRLSAWQNWEFVLPSVTATTTNGHDHRPPQHTPLDHHGNRSPVAKSDKKNIRKTKSGSVISRQVSKYVEYVHHASTDHTRPLALVGTFLAAKPKHFQKLQEFYIDRGFDILYYKGQIRHLLHPATAKNISEPLSESLHADPMLISRDMLVHAFSGGGFFFGHTLNYMDQNPQKFDSVLSRIKGFVYDSPTTVSCAPTAMAIAMTKNERGIKLLKRFWVVYYWFMRDSVAVHGTRSEAIFARNERGWPVLMMYSNSDVVSRECAQWFIEKLKANENADIFVHTWNDTPHSNLMRYHTEEYLSLLNDFLSTVGFEEEDSGQKPHGKS